jgi:chromate transporter
LAGLLLPSLLVVGGVLPFWQRIRYYSSVRKASAGANATVVGILFAVFCRPMWGSTVTSPLALGLFIIAFAALQFGRMPSWLLVILGVLVGWWL